MAALSQLAARVKSVDCGWRLTPVPGKSKRVLAIRFDGVCQKELPYQLVGGDAGDSPRTLFVGGEISGLFARRCRGGLGCQRGKFVLVGHHAIRHVGASARDAGGSYVVHSVVKSHEMMTTLEQVRGR